MASKIVLKKSSVAAKVPVAGDLDFGELAINYTDGKLYFKKADNTIDAFTTAAASAPVTSVGGNVGDITDAQLLASIKNVDGTGSGLDADTLDGNHASAFYLASNPNGYTSNTGTVTSVGAAAPLVSSGGTAPSISIPAANSTTNGYMSSAYASKLDGIAAGANNYTLPTATSTVLGGIELFSDTVQTVTANAVTATASRTYGVQLNSSGQAVVNVPWTDTNSGGTVTSIATSGAITGGTITTTGTISHSTADGFLHVPATGTTNSGKVLTAGATAGSLSWTIPTTGTVTSVSGTGTVSGLTLSGTVTSSGSLTLGGSITTPASGNWWRGFASIGSDGVMEVGRYIDLHSANAGTSDYDVRIECTGSNAVTFGASTTLTAGTFSGTYSGSLTSSQVTTALGYAPYNSTNPNGYTSNTGTVTSVSGTGTVAGLSLSGTVTTSGSLSLSGTLSASIDNISDEYRLFNNMGDNHGTRTSFDAQGAASSVNFGWRYVQGSTNGPNVNSAGQYYSQLIGLGNDYAYNSYGMQIAYPRNVTSPYIAIRYEEGGAFGAWQKISAGYADSAGSASSASNADTTDGYHASTSATANTIAVRDGNGYTFFNYINSNTANNENPTISQIIVTNGSDNYYRKASASSLVSQLGLAQQVANGVILENNQTITSNYTMTSGKNGSSAGPITINTGVTVTIPTGSSWSIV